MEKVSMTGRGDQQMGHHLKYKKQHLSLVKLSQGPKATLRGKM